MAHIGNGYFDKRGHFFKTPGEATASDLAAVLGRIGDGESLAPGIAQMLLDRRQDIEDIFAQHDDMVRHSRETERDEEASNVTPLNLSGKRDA
jgi:hypothetical protein